MQKARLLKYLKTNTPDVNKAMEQRKLMLPASYVVANIQDLLADAPELIDGMYIALPHYPLMDYTEGEIMVYEEGVLKDLVKADLDNLVSSGGNITPFTLRYWYANRAGDDAYLLTYYGAFLVPE